jgi:hypothetical protein
MSLAPICILYCKQCSTMNEYRICWFSRFGFPGEKSLCNVCIYHCIFSIVVNLYKVKILLLCWLQKGLARDCDKPCYSGRFLVLIF